MEIIYKEKPNRTSIFFKNIYTLLATKFKGVVIWALFFFVIYIILLIKVISFSNSNLDNLFFVIYSFLITLYILSRFVISFLYHPQTPIIFKRNYKPTITFIVPAKNEESNIAKTIRKFGEVDYPKDKIEIITINDGSTDDTLNEMKKVKGELKNKNLLVQIIDFDVNQGKRKAMAEGIKRAKNEILIFIDSDSFIDKDCVIHLTKYFSNERVGAVCGHTDVYNRNTNLLTKMQAVRYYISFKIYKSAESIFGTVTCCPGCCSAYHRKYVLEFLDEWENQSFLKKKCTFGDDRSLTNFTIKKYEAIYAPEAKAKTVVPDKFRKYLKQQQRWKKSWVRETFIASKFMWKKNFVAAVSFYTYVFLALVSPIVFFRAIFWYPYVSHNLPLFYLFGLFLMLLLHGLYYRAKVSNLPWFFAIVIFWFYTAILIWQLPWAIVILNNNQWGTR